MPPQLPYDDRQDLIKTPKLLELFTIAPEFATVVGYHAFDDQLPHADAQTFHEECYFVTQWLRELQALPRANLSATQQFDLRLFEHYHAIQQFYFEDLELWRRSPTAIAEVGQICFLTMLYTTDNEEKRFSDVAARLEALPRYVQEHQSRTLAPPWRWRDLALQSTAGMIPFFDAVRAAAEGLVSPALARRVAVATQGAQAEASAYLEWLKVMAVDERESWCIGSEHFVELIRLRKLGHEVRDILAFGEEHLARYLEQQRQLAQQLVGRPDIAAARAHVETQAPADFAGALETTRRACREAREFVEAQQLLDLPTQEQLDVQETPPFLRSMLPFAAVFPPAKFAPQQTSTYVVTPPTSAEDLRRHLNFTSIYNTAVHEGYPGHHVQLTIANRECTFLRSTPFAGGKAPELVEGWAHYCEELMKDRGFHDTPEGRFTLVSDLVWRAARVVIDVKLSSGEMSYDAGVQFLIDHCQIPKDAAQAELNRYTHAPAYQLSYLLGKQMILDLKAAVQKAEGPRFREAAFHNRLLRAGSIPVTMIRKDIFGID